MNDDTTQTTSKKTSQRHFWIGKCGNCRKFKTLTYRDENGKICSYCHVKRKGRAKCPKCGENGFLRHLCGGEHVCRNCYKKHRKVLDFEKALAKTKKTPLDRKRVKKIPAARKKRKSKVKIFSPAQIPAANGCENPSHVRRPRVGGKPECITCSLIKLRKQ